MSVDKDQSEQSLINMFRSASILLIGLVIGNGLALLGETYIARSLEPANYGQLALSYTIVSFVASIGVFGMDDGVTRLLSAENSNEDQSDTLRHAFIMSGVIGILFTASVYYNTSFIGNIMDKPSLSDFLPIFLPFIIIYPVSRLMLSILRSEGLSLSAVLARDIAGRLVPLIGFSIAILNHQPVTGAIIYWLAAPTTLAIVSIIALFKYFPLVMVTQFKFNKNKFAKIWSFSWPLAISTIVFILFSNMDILMIGYFLESSDVGFYRAILPLRKATTLLMTSFTFLFLPEATRYYENSNILELKSLYISTTKWIMCGTFPFILVFGLFSENIVTVFFGASYLPAAPALSILIFGFFFRAVVGLNGDVTKAINRPKIELYSAGIAAIINFGLNIILIQEMGIIGAAAATAIGYIIYNLVELSWIYVLIGIHPFSLNNFKPLIPPLIITIIIKQIIPANLLGLFELILVGIIIFAIQILSIPLTRSLDKIDRRILKKIIGKF